MTEERAPRLTERSFAGLIERSSLGTPAAELLKGRASPAAARDATAIADVVWQAANQGRVSQQPAAPAKPPELGMPLHRSIVAVDIEGSTTRTNPAKARLRHIMYDLLEEALLASGVAERHRDPTVDRGDGALVLIHPVDRVPKTRLLNTLVPMLSKLIAQHGVSRPDEMFRLRAVVHAGEVHYDRRGPFGEAIDVACRLLDASAVKKQLSQSDAPLVLVVSDDIYRLVIRHRYENLDDRAFVPLVQIEVGGQTHRGWVNVPTSGGLSDRSDRWA